MQWRVCQAFLPPVYKPILTIGSFAFIIHGMENNDLYLTVQQVANLLGMKRQGVHYHMKRKNFGEPFHGAKPPGEVYERDIAVGHPPTIWLKFSNILNYYQDGLDILQKLQNLATD